MNNALPLTDPFSGRHIGPHPGERDEMLKTIGVPSLDALIDQTVPANIRLDKPFDIQEPVSEYQLLQDLARTAAKNQLFRSYIGLGFSDTITPPVIQRNIFENPGWYTQYTPYQAEISQGRLEALLIFQNMISDLTGMEIANASLLDEATAAAEAMSMLHRVNSKKSRDPRNNVFLVSDKCLPQTIDVLKTRSTPLGIELRVADLHSATLDERVYGLLIQYPDVDGKAEEWSGFIEKAHAAGAMVAVAADLLSLALLTPPGEMGADIVLGSAQRFGVPMGFGGPHAAYFSTRSEFMRQMPGRIIGVSIDHHGRRSYRMTLQTREQHIRREKASSNICSNQALNALAAAVYMAAMGKHGLRKAAELSYHKAHYAAALIDKLEGYAVKGNGLFFKEFVVQCPQPVAEINQRLLDEWGILGGYDLGRDYPELADHMLICVTEMNGRAEIEALAEALAGMSASDTGDLEGQDESDDMEEVA